MTAAGAATGAAVGNRAAGESLGFVETRRARIALPPEGFPLDCGRRLAELTVAYETYGELTADKNNAIFVCHALTGDAHVAGCHEDTPDARGWWDEMIGPGKGIDTRYYYVVCANVLGGCRGTTGPSSPNPATGRPYGSDFPPISVGDMVRAHRLLLEHLGIRHLAALVGGSFGGMQALEWIIRFPDSVRRCILVATGKSLSSQALAFDIVGREAITSDPHWQSGDYYGSGRSPDFGLALARKLGHITYLSPEMMETKFGRGKTGAQAAGEADTPSMFQVESYLSYQGAKFIRRFDAGSYVCITRAMDDFDLVEQYGSLARACEPIRARVLIVALSSDWLFPPEQSVELARELLRAGKRVSYCRLQAPHGHDAFLVDIQHLAEAIHAFLPWVESPERGAGPLSGAEAAQANEGFEVIRRWTGRNARVLDIGCGNGALLDLLAHTNEARGVGLEIDLAHVIGVIDKGHEIFQGNADEGLACMPDGSFDCAVLSETLHELGRPGMVLREMLRLARVGVVAFPNAGHWRRRLRLLCGGRMPLRDTACRKRQAADGDLLAVHPFTLVDFRDLCRALGITVENVLCLPAGRLDRWLIRCGLCSWGADRVLARIARA